MRKAQGLQFIVTIAGIAGCLALHAARAETIIDEWATVKAPPLRR